MQSCELYDPCEGTRKLRKFLPHGVGGRAASVRLDGRFDGVRLSFVLLTLCLNGFVSFFEGGGGIGRGVWLRGFFDRPPSVCGSSSGFTAHRGVSAGGPPQV